MKKNLLNHLCVIAIILLAGCSSNSNSRTQKSVVNKAPQQLVSPPVEQKLKQPENIDEQVTAINSCRNALDSLKQINSGRAQKYNESFNSLVNAASQYNSVRAQISDTTRQTVDSMYQFKTLKLCSDINQALMDSLVASGEKAIR
ncbi:putative membrane protein YfhO [Buttiauxella sp. BIGb0471]|uniref:hypothetical protein n=1 Tax=Buttiauxella sp. BIGb0471 TaxID=2940597 RepID=UPI00216A3F82|nr:hypothetical protein [Buttiauxella sp. BIGb0471]MCS3604628.1 putative membrane protein YfhO [Buttiauxella sp. BIGb0471]